MTIQEFNQSSFRFGDRAIYKGKQYAIIQIDFEEALIGMDLNIEGAEPDTISWVRCENITHLSPIDLENQTF